MPRNGSGVYSLPSGNPVVTDTTIEASWANTTLSDIAAEITGSLPRSGVAPMAANLGMGNNKILNLADGTAATDAINKGQLDAHAAAADPHPGYLTEAALDAHAAAADPHPNYALESALGTASTKNTGTASGNVPLVGTKSATEVLAGLVELATQAEAEAGAADNVVMTPLKTAKAIDALGIKAGCVAHFAMTTAPAGWLKANGAAVSRTSYAALFAAIGTTFGVGDGSTTFNLPDLRGEFIRNWDDGRGVDSARVFGSAQAGAMESHSHSLSTTAEQAGSGTYPLTVGGIITSTSTTSAGTGAETRPRNIALLACIKY